MLLAIQSASDDRSAAYVSIPVVYRLESEHGIQDRARQSG
jgi:hypothetical protein